MRTVRVRNCSRGALLGSHVGMADGWWRRLRGLLGRAGLDRGEGLLIAPSRGVHMFGMRFPLDVLLLDGERRVRSVHVDLQPGRTTGMHRDVRYALELPVGTIESSGTETGDELEWTAH